MLTTLCLLAAHAFQGFNSPVELRVELMKKVQQPGLEGRVVQWFGDKGLAEGAAKTNGVDVAWAIRAPGLSDAPTIVREDGGPAVATVRIGRGDIFAAAWDFADGTGFRWEFVADGKPLGTWHNLEVYNPNPENEVDPNVPHGVLSQQPALKSTVFEGTTRNWWIYVPASAKSSDALPVMIFQDGQFAKDYVPTTLDNLIAKKDIPPMVTIFIAPGTGADGASDRSREYDTLSDAYARFLLQEILPAVDKIQKLKTDPASRALAGVSSGGICAFTAAWEHPEAFGKVLSWVGSFTDIAHGPSLKDGGHNYPSMIRLSDKKPIRVFLQDGFNDLDNQYGNWWLANQQMAKALAFKGYDYQFVGGQGFHSDAHGRAILPDSLRWLWRN